MRWLYDFLLESDLPWPLQAFWKLLTFSLGGLLIYAATYESVAVEGSVFMYVLAGLFFVIGLFTKLGDE